MNGVLFESKNKDKLRYKLAIKKAKIEASDAISDKLHEELAYKNSTCFWKTWKNKVCNKTAGKIRLECNPSADKQLTNLQIFLKMLHRQIHQTLILKSRQNVTKN